MASLCNFKVKYFEFLKLFSPVKLMQLCFKKNSGSHLQLYSFVLCRDVYDVEVPGLQ